MTNWRICLLRAVVCVVMFGATMTNASAQTKRPSADSLAGADLLRQRKQRVALTWSSVGVRAGLSDLSKAQQVAVLLDRRIDPDMPIELNANRVTLDDLLSQIAGRVDGGVTWLGPLAYIGPSDAVNRLRTLAALRAADVTALPRDQRLPLKHEASWQWEALAEPRKLVAELAAEANVEIEAIDLIAHDLWPAANLPRLSWTDRLTLLANEFDLTFEISEGPHVRLRPIVEPVLIERSYPGGKKPAELAAQWKQLVPDAQIVVKGGKLVVGGRLEDHELLVPRKSKVPAAVPAGVSVHTMTVREQPLDAVLKTLQQQLSLDLRIDEDALQKAKIRLDRRISFSVERVTLDELMATVLKEAGLTFRRDGAVYNIVPAEGQ